MVAILPDELDVTADNNTTVPDGSGGTINVAENCAAANINNAIRSLAAAIAAAPGWVYSGTSRPSAVQSGALWLDTTTATAQVLNFFDGSDDIPLLKIDATANTAAPALLGISGLTLETATATGDTFPFYDVSESAERRLSLQSLFNGLTNMAVITDIASSDRIPVIDASDSSTAKKIGPATILKIINDLTEDTSPDLSNDFLVSYDASASDVRKVAPVNLANFAARFTSSAQTITAGGLKTLAHSLGAEPTIIQVVYECTASDGGWSIGDRVVYGPTVADGNTGHTCYADATNVYFQAGSGGLYGLNKPTGASFAIDETKWEIYVRAW